MSLPIMPRDLPMPDPRADFAILLIRGERVLIDHELARLYSVETRALL